MKKWETHVARYQLILRSFSYFFERLRPESLVLYLQSTHALWWGALTLETCKLVLKELCQCQYSPAKAPACSHPGSWAEPYRVDAHLLLQVYHGGVEQQHGPTKRLQSQLLPGQHARLGAKGWESQCCKGNKIQIRGGFGGNYFCVLTYDFNRVNCIIAGWVFPK